MELPYLCISVTFMKLFELILTDREKNVVQGRWHFYKQGGLAPTQTEQSRCTKTNINKKIGNKVALPTTRSGIPYRIHSNSKLENTPLN